MTEPRYTVEQVKAYELVRKEERLFRDSLNKLPIFESILRIRADRADSLHGALEDYEEKVPDEFHREPLLSQKGINTLRGFANGYSSKTKRNLPTSNLPSP